jgi:glycosyltransferase involved in cell wall biosynthesis
MSLAFRLGVNALSARVGGGLTYVREQLKALEEIRPDIDLHIFVAPWNVDHLRRSIESTLHVVPVRSLASRLAFEQFWLPRQSATFDVLYCPGNFIPLTGPLPRVVTLQNASYFGRGRRAAGSWALRHRVETALAHASVRRADAIVVVSRSLFDEVSADTLPTGKCRVILSGDASLPDAGRLPNGVPPLRSPFLLAVANDYPHKRLDDLFSALKASEYAGVVHVVVVGDVRGRALRKRMALLPRQLRSRVSFLGPIQNRSYLRWLYEHAAALVVTSEVESFGFTILEAGSVGCPIIASDIPAHREVGGEAPMYFPVGRTQTLMALIDEVLSHPPVRRVWQGDFSWQQNALALTQVFEHVLMGRRPC